MVCRTDTNVCGFWLAKRTLSTKKFMPQELSRNQSIIRFDVILQNDWPIEQCLLHIRLTTVIMVTSVTTVTKVTMVTTETKETTVRRVTTAKTVTKVKTVTALTMVTTITRVKTMTTITTVMARDD